MYSQRNRSTGMQLGSGKECVNYSVATIWVRSYALVIQIETDKGCETCATKSLLLRTRAKFWPRRRKCQRNRNIKVKDKFGVFLKPAAILQRPAPMYGTCKQKFHLHHILVLSRRNDLHWKNNWAIWCAHLKKNKSLLQFQIKLWTSSSKSDDLVVMPRSVFIVPRLPQLLSSWELSVPEGRRYSEKRM